MTVAMAAAVHNNESFLCKYHSIIETCWLVRFGGMRDKFDLIWQPGGFYNICKVEFTASYIIKKTHKVAVQTCTPRSIVVYRLLSYLGILLK